MAKANGVVKIDKGIPIPITRRTAHYPLAEMKVGDSFAVPSDQHQLVRMAVSQHGRREGRRYTVRKQAVGFRCWRVE